MASNAANSPDVSSPERDALPPDVVPVPGVGSNGRAPDGSEAVASTRLSLRMLFELAVEKHASDLHLVAHMPPLLRIDGALLKADVPPCGPIEIKELIYGVLTDSQKAQFERERELDLSVGVQGLGRFRVNVHVQRGSVEAAFRLVPLTIRTLEELGLPLVAGELARKTTGLVLVTGPTGVGKTTTLTAMIDLINRERSSVIITIEDPIEYLHQHKRSIVKQREVYSDTASFSGALTRALRQDPNVIVVGEMRDLETISTALTAAETGHLVLATLHTPDAPQTVDRILDIFPPHQQQQVKVQLADCLQGIVSLQLLPRADGAGRIAACEIMVATAGIRHLIREHATAQLPTLMQTGAQYGMHTMDSCLQGLYERGKISYETAVTHFKNLQQFRPLPKDQRKR